MDRPVNVLMTLPRAELSAIGVKRISVGSGLSRTALGAFLRAAKEMKEHGTFEFAKDAAGYGELNSIFEEFRSS